MGEPQDELRQPQRAWLPYETVTTRVVWSVVAGLLLLLGTYLSAGERVTTFPDRYTSEQYLALVVDGLPGSILPELAFHSWGWFLFQVSHLIVAALWPLCLVRWRSMRLRVASALVVWGCVGWLFVVSPRWAFEGPLMVSKLLFVGGYGEDYQDEGIPAFLALLFWFTLPLPFAFIWRAATEHRRSERQRRGVCVACGYDLLGRSEGLCPECGESAKPTQE